MTEIVSTAIPEALRMSDMRPVPSSCGGCVGATDEERKTAGRALAGCAGDIGRAAIILRDRHPNLGYADATLILATTPANWTDPPIRCTRLEEAVATCKANGHGDVAIASWIAPLEKKPFHEILEVSRNMSDAQVRAWGDARAVAHMVDRERSRVSYTHGSINRALRMR